MMQKKCNQNSKTNISHRKQSSSRINLKKILKPRNLQNQPFMLRVNMMAKNAEAREKIVQCLQLMANHQIEAPHVGTMIYHFTNPCKESKENYFEFIELYANEEVFFGNTAKNLRLQKHILMLFFHPIVFKMISALLVAEQMAKRCQILLNNV